MILEVKKTYVTNDGTNDLHLPTLRTERIIVNTFVDCDSEPRTVDVVSLKFIVNHKSMAIEALSATYICCDIFGQNIENASCNDAHLGGDYMQIFNPG